MVSEKEPLWKVLSTEPDSHVPPTAIHARSMTSYPNHEIHKARKIKEPFQNKTLPERKALWKTAHSCHFSVKGGYG